MSSRTCRVVLSLILGCAITSGCALSDREAIEGVTDRGLLVVHPEAGFEVRDEMGQVVRWASGALGARVSVLLSPGIYEVRPPGAPATRGMFAQVRAGEVTRVDLRAAGEDPQAGASARSPTARAGP
jgi:hypothetical protein